MASWNVFKFCTALRALGAVMVAVVLGLAGFTYYAVVFVGYGPLLPSGGLDSFLSVVVLLLFHSLLAMLLWSYFATVLTDPGGVPPNWMPVVDEERGEGDAFVGSADADSGLLLDQNLEAGEAVNHRRRFCRQCNMFKPQRSHHCSVCGRCILKMDHHCVWVVNCVGALNYKYFLLFLFYTFLVTALVTVSLMPPLIAFLTADGDGDDDEDDVSGRPGGLVAMFIACVLNLSFSLSVFGFLAMHVSLVIANKTTIEVISFSLVPISLIPVSIGLFVVQLSFIGRSSFLKRSSLQIYEKKKGTQWQYDLGQRKNFEQVFGVDKRYWLLPAYSDEDRKFMPVLQGLEYPTRSNSDDLRQL